MSQESRRRARRELLKFDLWRALRAYSWGRDEEAYSRLLAVIEKEVPNVKQDVPSTTEGGQQSKESS